MFQKILSILWILFLLLNLILEFYNKNFQLLYSIIFGTPYKIFPQLSDKDGLNFGYSRNYSIFLYLHFISILFHTFFSIVNLTFFIFGKKISEKDGEKLTRWYQNSFLFLLCSLLLVSFHLVKIHGLVSFIMNLIISCFMIWLLIKAGENRNKNENLFILFFNVYIICLMTPVFYGNYLTYF